MGKSKVITFALAILFAFASKVVLAESEWLSRVDFGVDAGTDQKPRFYVDTVQPFFHDVDDEDSMPFYQIRIAGEGGDAAYNLGLGYRKLFNDNRVLLGVNSFFDLEDEHNHYRTGLGFEAFVDMFEFRANSYIGLSGRRMVNEHSAAQDYEKAVDGFDVEFGAPIPYLNWIKIFGGGYWYNYEKFNNKKGWKLRTELKPCNFSTLNFIVWDDNKGDTEFRVDARITIPLEWGSREMEWKHNIAIAEEAFEQTVDHSNRLLDRVEREYRIEVEKWVETASATIEIRRGN